MSARPTPQTADILIKARWIIPVVPHDTVLENCAIAIKDGQIIAITPITAAETQITATKVLDLSKHIVIPGLIGNPGWIWVLKS